MQKFWSAFYNFVVIPLFWLLFHAAGLFNRKVRRGIRGRRTLFETLERDCAKCSSPIRVWFHSSSMGEFEQARPIIAALKQKHKDINVIVSFFSPSGYDHSRSFPQAEAVTYLPFDSLKNARRFLDIVNPTTAVMVRYDVWPNHIWELRRRKIPAFIANATMKPNSERFIPVLRSFHRALYGSLTAILTVTEQDAQAFGRFRLRGVPVRAIGDTRYDQVWQRSRQARTRQLILPKVLKGRKVIVIGSSWPEDEAVLLPAMKKLQQYDPHILMILVPHEPTIEALEDIEAMLGKRPRSIRFSLMNDYRNEPVIIVDSVGILMALYQYAHVAYVGGSFRQGIHNVLEPAVYGVPVVFGPKHDNSQEAKVLVERGGGIVIRDQQDCYRTFRTLLADEKERSRAGAESLKLVKENVGATERFVSDLESHLRH